MSFRMKFSLVRVRTHVRKIVKRFENKRKGMLLRQGQYIRRVAMNSIKRASSGRRISAPGSPPVSHTGALKKFIRYAWDPITSTVIVGPLRLKHFRAPQALEYGGTSKWIRRTESFWRSGYQRVLRRPFMRPALVRSLQRMRAIANEVYR